jgi:RNA polymerase sigma factor (sigma-70 family)
METDKLLYQRFLEGDQYAFEELVLKNKDNLIYFLKRYVSDIFICEDIAQDVFAFIYVYKEKYNFKNSFKTYIYAIGKNKAVDYIRKYSRQALFSEENYKNIDEEELIEKVVKGEEVKLLHSTIKKLKIDYQRAIHLIDFEEMSYKETGVVMGKTVPQIKILIFRARRTLKNLLEREEYTYEKR